jgi:hypothetical protein
MTMLTPIRGTRVSASRIIPLILETGWPEREASPIAVPETGSVTAYLEDPSATNPVVIRKNVRHKKNGSGFIGVQMILCGFALRDRRKIAGLQGGYTSFLYF